MTSSRTGFHHAPEEEKSEYAIPDLQPAALQELILSYTADDFLYEWKDEENTKKYSYKELQRFQLTSFTANGIDSMADKVARLIEQAGETEIQEAFAIAESLPEILRCKTRVKNRSREWIEGNLPEIALILGDIKIFEKFLSIGENIFSPKEKLELFKVIISDEAKEVNKQRQKIFFDSFKIFIQNFNETNKDNGCETSAAEFEENLLNLRKGCITNGFVFDPLIVFEVLNLLRKTLSGDLFTLRPANRIKWTNDNDTLPRALALVLIVLGLLQKMLPNHHMHYIMAGLINFDSKYKEPPRLSINRFECKSSGLGKNFYLSHIDGNPVNRSFWSGESLSEHALRDVLVKDIANFKKQFQMLADFNESHIKSLHDDIQKLILSKFTCNIM